MSPETTDLERRLAQLGADGWTPADPPPLDLGRALAERAPRRRRARLLSRRAVPRRAGGSPLVLRPAFAGTLAVLLVAAGFGGGLLAGGGSGTAADDDLVASGRPVGLAAFGDAPAAAAATARLGDHAVTLEVRGLPRTREGQFYEVWALRSPTRLVSLGTFSVGDDGRARIRVPLSVDLQRFPILDVSLETADGDPAHSGASVLRSKPVSS